MSKSRETIRELILERLGYITQLHQMAEEDVAEASTWNGSGALAREERLNAEKNWLEFVARELARESPDTCLRIGKTRSSRILSACTLRLH